MAPAQLEAVASYLYYRLVVFEEKRQNLQEYRRIVFTPGRHLTRSGFSLYHGRPLTPAPSACSIDASIEQGDGAAVLPSAIAIMITALTLCTYATGPMSDCEGY